MQTIWARPGQTLPAHSANVSSLAADFGLSAHMPELLRNAGFLHDFGKNSAEFQNYMKKIIDGLEVRRGETPHSIFGAKRAYERTSAALIAAEVLSNIIAAHHGALYDSLSPDGSTPLADKLAECTTLTCADDFPSIDASLINNEIAALLNSLPKEQRSKKNIFFALSLLTKFAFSCLVDADRLDAYLHENGNAAPDVLTDWEALLARLEKKLAEFSQNNPSGKTNAELNLLRKNVSDSCAKSGLRGTGIYKLEVPTGGGKTLSGLRFALEHARINNLDRIIYVIPYLSILSQTAKEIRCALEIDNNSELLIEHHSDFFPDDEASHKFHTNRWDAPIILTTQVQFLESVFSAKGGDLRKLHNMAQSVLIFDEAQNIPIKCVHLFNSFINFLSQVCGSTALLCTATQPLLDKVERPIVFSAAPSIAPCLKAPERYRIVNALEPAGYSPAALANFVLEKHRKSTLIIVNTKMAAKSLYTELKEKGAPVLHLSTNMCSKHRDDIIAELRRRLDTEINEPVICVSTQLIEAGVDISFECAVRNLSGLDSILQAAGRCNRHGEFPETGNVYVVNIADENLDRLPDIKIGAAITRRLFDDNNVDINQYYEHYFYQRKEQMDYPLPDGSTIYDLLSENNRGQAAYKKRKDKKGVTPPALLCAIRSASENFCVIAKGATSVIVPYEEAESLLQDFLSEESDAKKRILLRKLGKYSVSLYSYQLKELRERGALDELNYNGLIFLERGFYDNERGVDLEGSHEFLYV